MATDQQINNWTNIDVKLRNYYVIKVLLCHYGLRWIEHELVDIFSFLVESMLQKLLNYVFLRVHEPLASYLKEILLVNFRFKDRIKHELIINIWLKNNN